jgi:ATP-dependent Lon protease
MTERTKNELKSIPVVPLRGGAVFPGITTTISIGRRNSLAAAQTAVDHGGDLLILVQHDAELENPSDKDLAAIGVLATVRDVLRAPHIGVQMLVELHRRVRFHHLEATEPYLVGVYSEITNHPDTDDPNLVNSAIAYLEQYAEALGEANQQVMSVTRNKQSAGERERLLIVTEYLEQELRIADIRSKIQRTPATAPRKPSATTCCASR